MVLVLVVVCNKQSVSCNRLKKVVDLKDTCESGDSDLPVQILELFLVDL